MDFSELSDELKEKVKACKTPEEMLALAKETGYTLSEEELAGIAGGGLWSCDDYCDVHGCTNVCSDSKSLGQTKLM